MTQPVEKPTSPSYQMTWVRRFERGFRTPVECIPCEVIDARFVAEGLGLTFVEGPEGGHTEPRATQYRAEEEMQRRTINAGRGVCAFAQSRNCWQHNDKAKGD